MSLNAQIQTDMVNAMRNKEVVRLRTLRMVKTAVKNKQVEKGEELSDEEVIRILQTLVKQRRDSAGQFRKGGRNEMAEDEEAEISVIDQYLPQAATDQEILTVVEQVVSEFGATSMKDMGRVMKETLSRLSGKTVDGSGVSRIVRDKLQQ